MWVTKECPMWGLVQSLIRMKDVRAFLVLGACWENMNSFQSLNQWISMRGPHAVWTTYLLPLHNYFTKGIRTKSLTSYRKDSWLIHKMNSTTNWFVGSFTITFNMDMCLCSNWLMRHKSKSATAALLKTPPKPVTMTTPHTFRPATCDWHQQPLHTATLSNRQ